LGAVAGMGIRFQAFVIIFANWAKMPPKGFAPAFSSTDMQLHPERGI